MRARAERAARVAAFGWALDVAHDAADHLAQTDWQAKHKAEVFPRDTLHSYRWAQAMGGHLAGQAVAQGAAVALVSTLAGRPSWGRVTAGLALSIASHGVLDRRTPVRAVLRATGSRSFADPHIDLRIPVTDETPHGLRGAALTRVPAGVRPVDGDSGAMFTRDADRKLSARLRVALPLHGMYLADQAGHRLFLLAAAVILGWA